MANFEKEVDVLSELPEVLHEAKEINAIANVEDPILEAEWKLIQELYNGQFILTAGLSAIERYEKMLNIRPSDADTIESRRFRILSRFQEQAPYTWKVLIGLLDSLLGEGNYEAERNVADKWVRVKLELTIGSQIQAVTEMLERVVPQNMIINIELRFNTWLQISQKNWGQVNTITWGDVREGVI